MDISVVVPLYNEAESLPELEQWIARVMRENNFTYEVIFVNDGSTDDSWGSDTASGRRQPRRARSVLPTQLWQKPGAERGLRPR